MRFRDGRNDVPSETWGFCCTGSGPRVPRSVPVSAPNGLAAPAGTRRALYDSAQGGRPRNRRTVLTIIVVCNILPFSMSRQRGVNQERWQQFVELCREVGLPLTIQRRTVLEAVLGRDDHPTAEQLYGEVQGRLPGISRTTVYRVLDMLVHIGIISKACHPGATARFDRNTNQHHHLVCLHCDKVIDLEDKRLDALKLPETRHLGFEITDFRVQLRGICADCRKKATTPEQKPARRGGRLATGFKKHKRKTHAPKRRRKTS